jgi:hypothetical protein
VLWCGVLQRSGLASSEFVMWRHAGVVRWFCVCVGRFMYSVHCNTPHHNTRAHYFAYLSRYGHLKAEVTNCTPDDGHVWCPKHVEAIKLHILSHLVGSLPFTNSRLFTPFNPMSSQLLLFAAAHVLYIVTVVIMGYHCTGCFIMYSGITKIQIGKP